MICKNGKKKFRLDPRTKLFLILLISLGLWCLSRCLRQASANGAMR